MAVPKLRFKDETWETLKLNQLFTKITLKNKGNIISNVISNSAQYGLVSQRDFFYKDIANSDNTEGYFVIEKNDFVYNPRKSNEAPYGPFNQYKFDEAGIVSPLYTCLRPKGTANSDYLKHYFSSSAWYKYMYANGNAGVRHDRVNITDDILMKMPVSMPNKQEQQKIADFLTIFDKRITAQQNIIADMEETKKGLLQKIFSQEIRFKDENGEDYPEWKEHYWKDDVKSIETGTPLTGDQNEIGIPLIKMGNIQNGKFVLDKLEYIKPPITNYEKYVIKKGDFFFNTRNTMELVGKGATWFYDSGKYIFNSNIARVKFNNINTTFWNYLYNTELFQNQIHARATGTTSVAAIYPRYMNNIKYKLPSLEEQNKIASFLSAYDKKIEAEKKILADLQEMKKGLLQQMFV